MYKSKLISNAVHIIQFIPAITRINKQLHCWAFNFHKVVRQHVKGEVVSFVPTFTGPALGMFEVFGRTGPQNLGGPQFWTLQKLTCQFERLWYLYGVSCQQIPDSTYQSINQSMDRILFRHLLQSWPKNQNAAIRCVLRAYNSAKCDCNRGSAGSAPDPTRGAYSTPQTPWERCRVGRLSHLGGWAMAHPKFLLAGPQCIWPHQ